MYLGTYPFHSDIYVELEVFPGPVIKLKYRKLSHLETPKKINKEPNNKPK